MNSGKALVGPCTPRVIDVRVASRLICRPPMTPSTYAARAAKIERTHRRVVARPVIDRLRAPMSSRQREARARTTMRVERQPADRLGPR
jgi:hypothetical protein